MWSGKRSVSDIDPKTRNWHLYIQYMIEFGQKVLTYTEGLDQGGFVADGRTYCDFAKP